MGLAISDVHDDPAEAVARVATARRARLLRVHRRRLRFEDLEDCYSQATLELMARSRRRPFEDETHVANALELRFKSRIDDRRRAIGGRSPIETALARAVSVDLALPGGHEIEDHGAGVERQVLARTEIRRLREVIADLSRDQQLVLASQALVDMEASEFCARHDWSREKYRKVAQRARHKLRGLVDDYERGERCRQLEPGLIALSAGVADVQAAARVRAHLANCATCSRTLAELDRSARSVAALLPLPGAATLAGGLAARLGAAWSMLRRMLGIARHPFVEAGAPGGAGVAGGSLASVGALKVGIAAVCVAGAASGYAACAHLGVLPLLSSPPASHAQARRTDRHTAGATGGALDVRRRAALEVARREASAPAVSAVSAVTSSSAPAQTVDPVAVVAATHHRRVRRLTTREQIRREFGTPAVHAASARSATAGASAIATVRREFGTPELDAASARSATAGAIATVRREFGTPAVHAASARSATGTATTGSAAAPATAPTTATTAAPSAPAQSASQASQTTTEFGFEK